MNGPNDAVYGILWIFGGLAVTVITYSAAAPGGVYIVAWGAMLFGGLKLAGALIDQSSENDDALPYEDRVRLGEEMTLGAMRFVANADPPSDDRHAIIEATIWRLTKKDLPPAARERAASTAIGDNFLNRVRAQRVQIPTQFHDLMIDAAAQVAFTDGEMSEPAEKRLRGLSEALEIDASALNRKIDAARNGED
ncbi:MAG TPA: hypothetical protein VM915_01215 [Verrucomicrobiae bacterium]|nr:hypothetical protein [Verrucomicrobiae bacterium]